MHINGGTSGKESTCQWRRRRRQGKIPWRRAWQPTPVVLPGKFHGQRSLAGYSPRDCKESDVTEHIHIEIRWCLSNWLKGHFKNSFIDLFLLCWIFFNFFIFYFIYFLDFILFFNFTILYWFCHISKWIHHRYTCVPHPEPPSLPISSLWVIPVHQPQASSIMHWTWTGDSFHIWYYTYLNAILPNHRTLPLSHRVQKTVLYNSVSFAVLYTGLLLPSF